MCPPGGSGSVTGAMRTGQSRIYVHQDAVFRWVWQHSVEDAEFTSWAPGAPLQGANLNYEDENDHQHTYHDDLMVMNLLVIIVRKMVIVTTMTISIMMIIKDMVTIYWMSMRMISYLGHWPNALNVKKNPKYDFSLTPQK